MVKNKLIMKKPKRSMNPMEAYRRKNKEKEKRKHKSHKYEQKEERHKEEEKHEVLHVPKSYYDDGEEDFEGQEDLLDLDPSAIQKILQEKQRMREKKYDGANVTANIQDLMQTFSKKPNVITQTPSQHVIQQKPTTTQASSNISSFMGENIMKNFNTQQKEHNKPIFPTTAQPNTSGQAQISQKSVVGDKRLQKRDNSGSIDPFMMTTMQGDYDPTQRKKNTEEETPTFNPLMGNFISQAPGVYKQVEKQVTTQKPVIAEPTVIFKEAELKSVPLRSQMEKEKASLIPVNVLKKKAAPKVEIEEKSKPMHLIQPTQSTMKMGIMNVTNVPAPKTSFAMPQNLPQKTAQNDLLSAFLSDISSLDD